MSSDAELISSTIGLSDHSVFVLLYVLSIFTALHSMQRGLGYRKAVRPSVRPSYA